MRAFAIILQVTCLLLISDVCHAQNILIKPYLQNASPTEMTIMWETDGVGLGEIEYGNSPFNLTKTETSNSSIGSGSSLIHVAVIDSLIDNTKYYYRVSMAGGQTSQVYSFITPAIHSKETSTQLMAISDMQRDGSHPNKFKEILEDGIAAITLTETGSTINDLEGIIIPGDLVTTGGTYSQWKDYFFNPADSIFPYVPIYPVPGNHEYFGGGLPNFLKYFELPDNHPVGLDDQCWYKDISNVRIIGLNSNSGGADQTTQLNWLHDVLDSTCMTGQIDFVFAQLHHPFKSELWTPGENSFTGMVIDSLEQFTTNCGKASVHFFGHTHGYSRGQSRDHKHLWVNVATAGGAIDNWGEFPNADYDEFVKSQDEYGFVLLDIEAGTEPKFTLKRYSRGDQDVIINNELKDEITIFKNEWIPSKPQNIFPASGDTVLNSCLILKGSQFTGIEDSLQASHWEVSKGGNFIDSLISTKWYQNENFYFEQNLQANDDLTDTDINSLSGKQIYHWRVRYRNQNLEWSPWSNPTTFYLGGGDTLSTNLVLNPDAENGITNWSGDIEALENAECGSVSPYEGTHNFAVGGVCVNESTVGLARQSIDLTPYANDINTGDASASYGAFMRNFGGNDLPEMFLEFYSSGTLISTTNSISNANGAWTYKEATVNIPSTTTSCIINLKGTRNGGIDNDSYFDALQLFILESEACPTCFGASNVDVDQDGFCDDIDCNDNDPTIYPGATELCDLLDNNCDNVADLGDSVIWTGNGGNNLWSDPNNWNQTLVPLKCQYVIINLPINVSVDSAYTCRGLTIGQTSTITVEQSGFLNINSLNNNINASVLVNGSMYIHGRCDVLSSSDKGFEVSGTLVNTNKMNSKDIQADHILLKNGGRFESLGITVFK